MRGFRLFFLMFFFLTPSSVKFFFLWVCGEKRSNEIDYISEAESLNSLNLLKIWMFPKIVVPPKSSILIGFSIINHPFWGTTILGNPHLLFCSCFSKIVGVQKTSMAENTTCSRFPMAGFAVTFCRNLGFPIWGQWADLRVLEKRWEKGEISPFFMMKKFSMYTSEKGRFEPQKMKVDGRWCSFSKAWFSGSMLVFCGVTSNMMQ